jgi:C-terminal processing protease CtpA/Prc
MVLAMPATSLGLAPAAAGASSSPPAVPTITGIPVGGPADLSTPPGAKPRYPMHSASTTRAAAPSTAGVPSTAGGAGNWCAALRPGPGSTGRVPVALSAAHDVVREFGVDSAFNPADDALAAALAPAGSVTPTGIGAALRRYAAALPDTCARRADPAVLGSARVHLDGDVAVVRPGTGAGPVRLPAGTRAGVIDLRGLPAVDGLAAALARAVSPFLATPVPGPAVFTRINDGPKDEFVSPFNVYSTSVGVRDDPAWAPTGQADLPLVLLTDAHPAPATARFAGALRMARRAYLAGAGVSAGVAETTWRGVGSDGLAVRTSALDELGVPQVTAEPGQTIRQDDPNDPATASYRRDFVAPAGTQRIDVTTEAAAENDVDVYLLKDLNGDGAFSFPGDLVAQSAGSTPDEDATLVGKELSGHYEVLVHGFSVPAGTASMNVTTSVGSGRLWPDVIPADLPATAVPRAPAGAPPPVEGAGTRTAPAVVDPSRSHPIVTGRGEIRAGLLIVHGLTRRYYKYFDVEGDRIDQRLIETLAEVDRWDGRDRRQGQEILIRFGQALHDGHQATYDLGPPLAAGLLPLYLEDVGGVPAVRRSVDPQIHPGDTILAIDGRPIRQVYADAYRLVSTATPGRRFLAASQVISQITGPETLLLADPAGRRRSVRTQPVSVDVYESLQPFAVTDRPSGLLSDLNAPDVAYLNLDLVPLSQVDSALVLANSSHAKALVVDMRGYPGASPYQLAARLIRRPFTSTPFIYNHFDGPDQESLNISQLPVTPALAPAWDGPIVLLTGPHAISAAETFMQMLVAFNRPLAIVGQQSSGTTGNVSGVQLPGGFAFVYTGMLVTNVDGSRFMGVGIQPDVRVPVTAPDLASGTDRDLLTAIDLLHAHGL